MNKIKYSIITFPGSNCDHDIEWISQLYDGESRLIWHKDSDLQNPDIVVLPGGFSFGDYLRCGALAKYSSIMNEIIKFAKSGGLVLGICNGFQILTEVGLLPGILLKNKSMKFICKNQHLKVINNNTPFTCDYRKDEVIKVPIAHKDGYFYADEPTMNEIIKNNQIVFCYSDENGNINDETNPNGSILNIAGITNKEGNVLGLMPHPERSAENIMTSTEGSGVFKSIKKWLHERI